MPECSPGGNSAQRAAHARRNCVEGAPRSATPPPLFGPSLRKEMTYDETTDALRTLCGGSHSRLRYAEPTTHPEVGERDADRLAARAIRDELPDGDRHGTLVGLHSARHPGPLAERAASR